LNKEPFSQDKEQPVKTGITRKVIEMNRNTVGFLVLIVVMTGFVAHSMAAVVLDQKAGDSEYTLKLFGFSQIDMRGGDGNSAEGGLFFKAQRIRVGAAYFHENWFSFLLVDFNQPSEVKEAGLPKIIKDAFVGYRFSDAAFVRMGMMKAPTGLTFTTHSWDLDIAERNHIDKGLMLERDFGIMLSGRQIGGSSKDPHAMSGIEVGHEQHGGYGFGYDIGVFNPAGRSSAVIWDEDQKGDALAYAGRLHYDFGLPLHFEASYGLSENAGGLDNPDADEDYTVFDTGFDSFLLDEKLSLKGEYVYGQDIQGVDGWEQSCFSGMAGYMLTPTIEGVVKVYAANAEKNDVETSLTNTYVGLNFFINPLGIGNPHLLQSHRIQLNYVFVGGDNAGSAVEFNGIQGHMDDCWIMQWQYKF